jgi:hypothetical protein
VSPLALRRLAAGVVRAAAAMQAVVLAEVPLEVAGVGRVAAADRAEVAGPVEAAVQVVVAGRAAAVEAAARFRRIPFLRRVSSNPEVPANFNKRSLLLVA